MNTHFAGVAEKRISYPQIEIQGNSGKVVEINWHDTVIDNDNDERVIIPNSVISSNIIKNIKKK